MFRLKQRDSFRGVQPTVAALLFLALFPSAVSAQIPVPFAAVYSGDFSITFGTGPGGTNDLLFNGLGAAIPLGLSIVEGHSTTRPRPGNLLVSDIVTDEVILTDANGDELWLENSGSETLYDPPSEHPYIVGSGTFKVTGGTGRYRGAKGKGTFNVVAVVSGPTASGVEGVFVLIFAGTLTR